MCSFLILFSLVLLHIYHNVLISATFFICMYFLFIWPTLCSMSHIAGLSPFCKTFHSTLLISTDHKALQKYIHFTLLAPRMFNVFPQSFLQLEPHSCRIYFPWQNPNEVGIPVWMSCQYILHKIRHNWEQDGYIGFRDIGPYSVDIHHEMSLSTD